jgi:hypothetical protein
MRRAWAAAGLLVAFVLAAGGARAEVILAGFDYFTTVSGVSGTFSGTYVDFNGGPLALTGNAVGPGNTDTIIQRLASITVDGGPGQIQVTELSLRSVDLIPGPNVPAYVRLDPGHLADDIGTLTISSNGTFTSFFDVFFEIDIGPASFFGQKQFSATGTWSATAPANAVDPNGGFFPGVTTHTADGAQHVVQTASIPEPSTWAMLMLGFAGLGFMAHRRRNRIVCSAA